MMIPVRIIVLSGELSYDNAKILLPNEYGTYGVEPIFGDYTLIFFHQGECVQSHTDNVKLIQIDTNRRTTNGPLVEVNATYSEMRYNDSYIIPEELWVERGIPNIFGRIPDEKQFVWSDQNGTYAATESDIVSVTCRKQSRPMRNQSRQQVVTQAAKKVPVAKVTNR